MHKMDLGAVGASAQPRSAKILAALLGHLHASLIRNRDVRWAKPLRHGMSLLALSLASLATVQANSVTYAYDELGRLIQATDSTAGQSIIYAYDAAGNITSQTASSLANLTISGFTPNQGSIGGSVTIFGTGFSTTLSSNAVQFNGAPAAVTAATATALTVTVPAAATTGPIEVTVGATGVTSNQSFIITNNGTPTIASFSPTTGSPGTSVTITGTNFLTTTALDKVMLNGTPAAVSAATATSLTVSVPPNVGSGPIQVVTPFGTATSNTSFVVPPNVPGVGILPTGSIATTAALASENSGVSLAVPSAGSYVIGLFNATQGDPYVRVVVTGDAAGAVVLDPDGAVLNSIGSVPGYVDMAPLPRSGTYSVVVTGGGSVGTAYVNIARAQITPLDLGWGNLNEATNAPYTRTGFTFSGEQGEVIQLQKYTQNTAQGSPTFSLVNSSGVSVWTGPSASTVTLAALPATGSYTLFADPGFGTGLFYFYSGPGVTLTVDGAPSLLTVLPNGSGQTIGRASFQATAGQALTVLATQYNNMGLSAGNIGLYENNTANFLGSFVGSAPFAMYLPSAPATDTYFIDISNPGPTNIQLLSAPGASNVLDSSTASYTVPNQGQLSVLSFAASTSGYVEINLNLSQLGPFTIYGPGPLGRAVTPAQSYVVGNNTLALGGLAAGTYYLYFIPQWSLFGNLSNGAYSLGTTGSTFVNTGVMATVSSAVIQSFSGSGTLSAAGRVGQNYRFTNTTGFFSTARSLTINNTSGCGAAVVLHNAGDSGTESLRQLTGGSTNSSGVAINATGTTTISFISLAATGTYTLEFMPAPGCALNFSASIR